MAAFNSDASYCAGVFSKPKITASKWPERADLSAAESSCKIDGTMEEKKLKLTSDLQSRALSLQACSSISYTTDKKTET